MVICATPGCGTPGRPLAACDMCQGRLYCGSHCLIPIQPRLLQQIIRGNENHVNAEERLSQNVIDRLRACSTICPPCYSNFSIFVSSDFAEDDENEEENEDDDQEVSELNDDDKKAEQNMVGNA